MQPVITYLFKYVKLRRSDVLTQTICHTLNGLFLLKTKYNMSRAWNFMHFVNILERAYYSKLYSTLTYFTIHKTQIKKN